jgi:catechol 2,3-dioxygenase-like lactoylglutathione lyase family enzyme
MTGLGHYLQGIQHVGITVENLEKSLEFYIEVLGGKLVVGETRLVGDTMQNTLFQKEELDAIAQGITLQSLEVPNLRDSEQALDVRFISFGNAVVELIHFRDPEGSPQSPTVLKTQPSHIAHITAKHLSFHVKESVDLGEFAKMLEAECQKRNIANVVFNRIIQVKTAAERAAIATQYNCFKFWDEPNESEAKGTEQPDQKHDWGVFEGWSLFYCKGPNGEQLEFNQVTRNVKELFSEAQRQYDQANGTNFGSY